MDVTKATFADILPEISAALQNCEFVAVDFEMSGINLAGQPRITYADTMQERYAQQRVVASRFKIIQMGISIVSKVEKTGSSGNSASHTLVARPYNFYTFAADGDDVILSLSAVHFLKDHGMDFNKWIREGVSYTNAAREEELIKRLDSEHERDEEEIKKPEGGAPERTQMNLTKPADVEFMKKQMEVVKAWWEESEILAGAESLSEEEKSEAARRRKELTLARTNAFMRRALFEAIEIYYPDLITESRNNQVVVLRLSAAEKAERMAAREAARQSRRLSTVGMRLVFKAMSACARPLVVHNGFFDLLFMMAAFHKPLPEKLVDFKADVRACFPAGVYDTRLISTREDLLGKSLGDKGLEGLCQALVQGTPEGGVDLELAEGFEKYGGSERQAFAHEAGYDAYLTGAVFARMQVLVGDAGLEKLKMMVFSFRSMFVTNLGEDRDWPVYGEQGELVFHLGWEKEAGKDLKDADLMKLFGDRSADTWILWIDDCGAFAVLQGKEGGEALRGEDVLKALPETSTVVRMTTFKDWCAAKEAETEAAGEPVEVGKDGWEKGKRLRVA